MWKLSGELNHKTPKYKQIIAAIINDVEKGVLRKNDQLPSINELSFEYDIARDTVEKAYRELKERGIIGSVRGKGYYVEGLNNPKLRILLILNKISTYKKIIYYAFLEALGNKATVDLQIHHYNAQLLKQILDDNLGKFHYYVLMPHFFERTDKVDVLQEIQRIPQDELVIMDKLIPSLPGDYLAVYQDFEHDISDALEGGMDLLEKYKRLILLFPPDENYPPEIVQGFRSFCLNAGKPYQVAPAFDPDMLQSGTAFVVIEETDLVEVIRHTLASKLKLGKDLGVVSFNETPLKEILAGGITTISTDFKIMGATTASFILQNLRIKFRNPFSMIRRKSL